MYMGPATLFWLYCTRIYLLSYLAILFQIHPLDLITNLRLLENKSCGVIFESVRSRKGNLRSYFNLICEYAYTALDGGGNKGKNTAFIVITRRGPQWAEIIVL